ncbi:hypothetical protein [Staphylothermus hellenicus]|uniref:VapB-type antitoxin n=1 Tax=Staphylothermus hellenicus (strain DSM 12710 / JCM 10830 / BK20S6-10-b1 / P8) TaxID=591019 RepID=D7DB86_STAHD|nr:hypothetical protein [Staphylothermus hellenicus]ADI31433.1 hypothetical protein Shell_0296 [Staphylothermus hellenicus DSM 12710]
MSDLITVRVPREIKEKMRKYRNINWSEVVRKAILERLAIEEAREKKLMASKVMDSIREKILRTHGPTNYDSSEAIRYWRELRK